MQSTSCQVTVDDNPLRIDAAGANGGLTAKHRVFSIRKRPSPSASAAGMAGRETDPRPIKGENLNAVALSQGLVRMDLQPRPSEPVEEEHRRPVPMAGPGQADGPTVLKVDQLTIVHGAHIMIASPVQPVETAGASWLGVTVARYACGVELFHLLLHSGLARRIRNPS